MNTGTLTPLQQATLRFAKKWVGERETDGRNHGPFVARVQMWFGRWALGQPWCAMFATWCVYSAARQLGIRPRLIKSASSSAIYAWARANGALLQEPEAGCLGLVRGGSTGFEHTFLVHTVAAGEVITVEGNLSDSVRWNRRAITSGYAWVRIA